MTLRLGCSHCERIAANADLCDKRRTRFVAEKRCFWVGEMKKLPSEHGDQSIKDQPQTVWGEEEEEEWRDALISVVPVLTTRPTLAVGLVPSAGVCFDLILFFFFFLLCAPKEEEEKKINTWTGASFQNWSGCQGLSFGDFCSPLYF